MKINLDIIIEKKGFLEIKLKNRDFFKKIENNWQS